METRIDALGARFPLGSAAKRGREEAASGSSFGELLERAFDAVNQAQWEADGAAIKLATGEIEDIHQVTILAEKANLSLQLAIALRNKVVEAYQEISRMQI